MTSSIQLTAGGCH